MNADCHHALDHLEGWFDLHQPGFQSPWPKADHILTPLDHDRSVLMPSEAPISGNRFIEEYRSYRTDPWSEDIGGYPAYTSLCRQQAVQHWRGPNPHSCEVSRQVRHTGFEIYALGLVQGSRNERSAIVLEREGIHHAPIVRENFGEVHAPAELLPVPWTPR